MISVDPLPLTPPLNEREKLITMRYARYKQIAEYLISDGFTHSVSHAEVDTLTRDLLLLDFTFAEVNQ